MDPVTLRNTVESAVQSKLAAGDAFTSACISHPIIKNNPDVRHREVNDIIRDMWASGQMVGDDDGMQADYNRSLIDVYPGGPGSAPVKAFCYHPDSFDPLTFKGSTRVLVRNPGSVPSVTSGPVTVPDMTNLDDVDDDSDDDTDNDSAGLILSNLSSGDAVTKQCDIQSKSNTLNIPRFVIEAAGFQQGESVLVTADATARTVTIRKSAPGTGGQVQVVDKEGRIRLHGARVAALCGTPNVQHGATFKALLVSPTGKDKYIQIS